MYNQLQSSYKDKPITYLLIFSLLITTAKGLRFGSDIGIGELTALLISAWFIILYKGRIRNNIDKYTINFWLILIFLLLMGWFIRINFHNLPNPFPRTLIAYLFCFFISYGILNSDILTTYAERTSLIYMEVTLSVLTCFSVLILLKVRTIFGLNLYWLDTDRFQGWSLDPNQVTIPFIITPFLLLNYYEKNSKSFKQKLFVFLMLFLNIYVGLATGSDSLISAWAIGIVVLFASYIILEFMGKKGIKIKNILLLMMVLTSFFVLFIFKLNDILSYIYDFLMKDGQLDTRINIWKSSINIIKQSPLVGLGPDMGRDLGGENVMGEAHNNILQLGVSTGILGIVILLSYYLFMLKDIVRSKNPYLIGGFIALFVFGLTHYTLRHPLYWFMLLLIYCTAKVTDNYRNGVIK